MGNIGTPAPQTGAGRYPGWLLACCLFALTGMALRVADWSSQILLDDEWHALNFVFTRSLLDVFLQQGLGANSIPVSALLAWSPFLATSPLWSSYAFPNNFTNHSAYQFRYDPIPWRERSPERDLTPGVSMKFASIPQFYFRSPLVAQAKGIIEYPLLIGDQLNLYYYYQHFHRRPVVAGFVTDNVYAPLEPGRDFVYGDWLIDSVMGAMPAAFRKSASWKTMVDLHDINALRSRFKGWIIIHRDPLSEIFQQDSDDVAMSVQLVGDLSSALGDPTEMNDQLAVWRIE